MQIPFISRKQHDLEAQELNREIERLRQQILECQDDKNKLACKFDEVLPKLARPYLIHPGEHSPNFRLVVEFSPTWVQEAFDHGNDQMMIKYTVERLAYQIESEFRKMNFIRYEDFELMRPRW